MTEIGLDLHEWETQWQQLHDEGVEHPEHTLPEAMRLIEMTLRKLDVELATPPSR